jgi:hypothetical protein
VFAYQVRVMSRHGYKTIYANFNLTYLIKRVKSINLNLLILCWVNGSYKKLSALNVACRVQDVSKYKYKVNLNPTYLIKQFIPFNSNWLISC